MSTMTDPTDGPDDPDRPLTRREIEALRVSFSQESRSVLATLRTYAEEKQNRTAAEKTWVWLVRSAVILVLFAAVLYQYLSAAWLHQQLVNSCHARNDNAISQRDTYRALAAGVVARPDNMPPSPQQVVLQNTLLDAANKVKIPNCGDLG